MPKPETVLNPGDLRHKVTIEAATETQDDFGQTIQAWTPVVSAWAQISAITSREYFQSNQLSAHVSHTITMRYPRKKVGAGMRVTYGPRVFSIYAANNVDERNAVLKLTVLEINGSTNG